MRSLRSLFVCPCARCREERRDEEYELDWPTVIRRLEAFIPSGNWEEAKNQAGTQGWRRVVEKRAHEYPRADG